MVRKVLSLPDATWLQDYVTPTSRRHHVLAGRIGVAPAQLRGESRVLAALVEVGRQAIDEQVEVGLYDDVFGRGVPDADAAAAFAIYDAAAFEAFTTTT